MINEKYFSTKYTVRKLTNSDIPQIYDLCRKNTTFYEYCPPMVTEESLAEDLTALPPNIQLEAKYFVGFYNENKLVAILDLIDGYPEDKIAFIGLFMTDTDLQGKGIGSAIIAELSAYLKSLDYTAIRLAWVKGNPQSEHFWIKNAFTPLRESTSPAAEHVILAERIL